MPLLLSPRLERLLELTPNCESAADIGTDHGLFAARLVQSGRAKQVFCTDLSEASLQKARDTFARLHLTEHAHFLCGDGLDPIRDRDLEVVIIAGLGGDTLCRVLDQPKSVLEGKVFLLQPMSKHEPLRRFLMANGFCVEDERLVRNKGRIYPVLRAIRDGKTRSFSPIELYCGAQNLSRRDETTRAYLKTVSAHLARATRHDPALIPVSDALAQHLRSLEEPL